MKEIIVKNFDGIIMSAVIGNRVELDENKAMSIVNDIATRETAMAEKIARIESLRAEADALQKETNLEKPIIEADAAEAKSLIKQFIECYNQRSIIAPKDLVDFIGDKADETPSTVTESAMV